MADLNGMWNLPKKGLSTVANPGANQWSMIIDTENLDAVTVILGSAGPFTTIILGPPGVESVFVPAPIVVNQADYNGGDTVSWTAANRVLLSATVPVDISGFVATPLKKDVLNTALSVITLKHEDVAGEVTAANRIHIPGGVDLPLNQDDNVSLWYDSLISRWRLV